MDLAASFLTLLVLRYRPEFAEDAQIRWLLEVACALASVLTAVNRVLSAAVV